MRGRFEIVLPKEIFFPLSYEYTSWKSRPNYEEIKHRYITDFIIANVYVCTSYEQCCHRFHLEYNFFVPFFHCNFTNCIFKMKMSLMDGYGSI